MCSFCEGIIGQYVDFVLDEIQHNMYYEKYNVKGF